MAATLAVILAAGAATRLRPLTDHLPKCLLKVGGRPLLDWQLEALASSGIRDIVLVTGFEAAQLERRYAGRARIVRNPEFETTNNLFSLRAAREEFSGRDFLCLHADVLFSTSILADCQASPDDVCVVLDTAWVEETMKAQVEAGVVTRIGKDIPRAAVFGTFLGIARFSGRVSPALGEVLEELAGQPANRQAYFTACLLGLARRGFRIGYALTSGAPWIEIDSPADLERARRDVLPALQGESGNR